MALASFVDFPSLTPEGRNEWTFTHAADHVLIKERIFTLFGIDLELRVIDPFPEADIQSWLRRHQDLHNQMCGLLGVAGKDLSTVDFNDEKQRVGWMYQNFREHDQVHTILAI